MKTAKDYPTTTQYGWVKDYPLHTDKYDPVIPLTQRLKYPGAGYGFHTGEDRAMPTGTPIYIKNKISGKWKTVAKSGATGYVTGPHVHVGKYAGGWSLRNPNRTGFALTKPKVVAVGEDSVNGKYVKVRNVFGTVWVYLHLSSVSCKVGDSW